MGDAPLETELHRLRADNDRLRRMLAAEGVPAELRHRINNTFAMFRAVVRRSAETGHSVEDFAAHLDGRLDALLRLHYTVMSDLRGGVDLYAILANEMLAHALQEGPQIRIEGSEVRLPGRMAEILGLAIHELIVNAIKFGALSRPGARIDIDWRLQPQVEQHPLLILTWRESGVAAGSRPSPTSGFGTEVLTAMLPYQLKARTTLDLEPDGLRFEIAMPLPDPETDMRDANG